METKKTLLEITTELKKYVDASAILEMSGLTNGKNYIGCNPDAGRNWFGEEYFKFYDHGSAKRATKVTRIKFRTPEYVVHYNDNWKLNSKEKKELIKELNQTSKAFPEYNNFQELIMYFNYIAFEISYDKTKEITLAFQDNLPKEHELKYILPIDLPIPDYTKLK